MNVFTDPVGARVIFGLILAWSVAATFLTRSGALKLVGGWLVIDWLQASYLYEAMSAQYAPWVVPALSAVITIPIARAAIRHNSYAAWSIVGLMVCALAVNLAAFVAGWQGTWAYYFALNMLFVLRAVVLGGSAGVVVARASHSAGVFPARSVD